MSKKLDFLSGFGFGEGAFRDEGAPVDVALLHCTPTFWVRALDGNAMRDLADAGVNMGLILTGMQEAVAKGEMTEAESLSDEQMLQRVKANIDNARAIVDRLLVKWEGMKRADGSPVECNEKTRQTIAGYPEIVTMLIVAALSVARDTQGNSESSSAGTSTLISVPAGEPIDETALPQA